MVISKIDARRISFKLIEKEKLAIEILEKDFQGEINRLYNASIPDTIQSLSKTNAGFFSFSNSIKVLLGRDCEWVDVLNSDDVVCNSNNCPVIILKRSNSAHRPAIRLKGQIQKQKLIYNRLRYETEQFLLRLRTYKNIVTELPIVAELLPEKQGREIKQQKQNPNFRSLKKKLKEINSK